MLVRFGVEKGAAGAFGWILGAVECVLGFGGFEVHFVFAVVHEAESPVGFDDLLGEVDDCGEGFGEDGGSWDLVGRGLGVVCKLPSFP